MSQQKRKARKTNKVKLRPRDQLGKMILIKGRQVGKSMTAQMMEYYKYGNAFVKVKLGSSDGKQ